MEIQIYSILIYDINETYSLNYPLSVVVKEISTKIDVHRIEHLFILCNYELDLYTRHHISLDEAFGEFIKNFIDLYRMYVEDEIDSIDKYVQKCNRILTKLITKK